MQKSGNLKRLILGGFLVATVGLTSIEFIALVVAKNEVKTLASLENKPKANLEDWKDYTEEVLDRIKTSAVLKEASDRVEAWERALIFSIFVLLIFLVIAYCNPLLFEPLIRETLPEDYLSELQALQNRWRQQGLSEEVIREETYLCMLT